jgi:hypothetical protein
LQTEGVHQGSCQSIEGIVYTLPPPQPYRNCYTTIVPAARYFRPEQELTSFQRQLNHGFSPPHTQGAMLEPTTNSLRGRPLSAYVWYAKRSGTGHKQPADADTRPTFLRPCRRSWDGVPRFLRPPDLFGFTTRLMAQLLFCRISARFGIHQVTTSTFIATARPYRSQTTSSSNFSSTTEDRSQLSLIINFKLCEVQPAADSLMKNQARGTW